MRKPNAVLAEVERSRAEAAREREVLAARMAGEAASEHVRRGLSRTVADEPEGERELLLQLLREVRRQGELLERVARAVGVQPG